MNTVEVAKLHAGFKALRFALEAGFRDIKMEGDNLVVCCIALEKQSV